jgi:phospholipid-translocating ATPase
MLDGLYQSVICFYVAYLLFEPTNAVTSSGLGLNDRERFGVYVAPAAVISINVYILLNTYRWDWLMVLLVAISILLVWFWTGVYSAFESSGYFYKSAVQCFGEATFWAVTCVAVIMSLLPRFFIKTIQKVYFPYDVDIIREQVRQGKFSHLDGPVSSDDISKAVSSSSSDIAKPSKHTHYPSVDEDQRPIYPPSVAPTATTRNPRSQNGSDGTDYTRHRMSLEQPPTRQSIDRSRPSYDRMRASMDVMRPSYEQSPDFTSAARLSRLESSHSFGPVHTTATSASNYSTDDPRILAHLSRTPSGRTVL